MWEKAFGPLTFPRAGVGLLTGVAGISWPEVAAWWREAPVGNSQPATVHGPKNAERSANTANGTKRPQRPPLK